MKTIDELLQSPYWVIDILPKQVPKDSPGQFFAVEEYYLEEKRLSSVKQKHIDLVLKLNCYKRISTDEWVTENLPPEEIARQMRTRYLCIMVGDSMIVSEPDELHMTVYAPDAALLELIRSIAAGEGLYVWKPPQQDFESQVTESMQ